MFNFVADGFKKLVCPSIYTGFSRIYFTKKQIFFYGDEYFERNIS